MENKSIEIQINKYFDIIPKFRISRYANKKIAMLVFRYLFVYIKIKL